MFHYNQLNTNLNDVLLFKRFFLFAWFGWFGLFGLFTIKKHYMSLCIQNFSFWRQSFSALALFWGRELNSRIIMPLCVVWAKCNPIVSPR